MKKCSLLLSFILLFCMMAPAALAAPEVYQEVETIHTEFGDLKVTTTTVIHDTFARSNRKSADRTRTVEAGDSVIAKITLSATFGYDGKTAWVISASGSHTTYDGWSYGSEKIGKSNSTASLSAALDHSYYASISVDISMTCSPTGQIS